MLRRKMWRDIKQNLSQFITIYLMVFIGVMVYTGIESYMDGMKKTADHFYNTYNLQDLNVVGEFTNTDLNTIKDIENVKNAEGKLVLNAINGEDANKSFLLNFIESNVISQFYVCEGEKFDASIHGAWLDNFYAEENNLHVGDSIKIKYDSFVLEEKIVGLINVPDHLYDVKDEAELLPNRETYGFVYLGMNELPEQMIKMQVMDKMHLTDEKMFDSIMSDFNYKDYIPYNYIMVDVDNKENVSQVKNEIEDKVNSALAIMKIEDTLSYSMYQGEIDEGSAYVGIFSGLFLFIAMLSVITTMTRVVKKQKMQIVILKALGFKNKTIILHYVSYGFWVSLFGTICGLIAGRYFIGSVFMGMEMDYFEIPNGVPVVNSSCYFMAVCDVICVSIITFITCYKYLMKSAAESLRTELPKVKSGSLNITSKGIFKHLSFSSKWNLRDIIRNKFRTITGIVGITGCCVLIVCAFGMLNSMHYFIKLQFEELYNFNYKLVLKENLTDDEISGLMTKYGNATSQTLGIEIKNKEGNKEAHTIFVTDAFDYIRFQNNKKEFITLDSNEGIYVTYKLAEMNNYQLGDVISWHIYGDTTYYESKIVGFNKDPQNQNITMTKEYLENLGIKYQPDSIYTNQDLKENKEIKNVLIVQDIDSLEDSVEGMLSMMQEMIIIIIVFAILLGGVIIYNMGILSYSEKQYQFATLKVLGFKDKQIERIYIKQNNWLSIISIILGLPLGHALTSWLFKTCLDETFDFGVNIHVSTYFIAIVSTYVVSYLVSKILAKKIKKIDMVTSLKATE